MQNFLSTSRNLIGNCNICTNSFFRLDTICILKYCIVGTDKVYVIYADTRPHLTCRLSQGKKQKIPERL